MWNFESWTGRDLNSPAEARARTYLCKERSLGMCLLMLLAGAKKGYLVLDLDWSVNLVEECFPVFLAGARPGSRLSRVLALKTCSEVTKEKTGRG